MIVIGQQSVSLIYDKFYERGLQEISMAYDVIHASA